MENNDIEVLLKGMIKAGGEWYLSKTLEKKDDKSDLKSEQFGEKK
ncbi:hypothetical protein [Herbiconiux daphne]|uniref:Uncharacterized protein n=1 Tax=Herbiconiux daphne TaxID=2970914 RepID=A0ABT2HAR0_9MICO|nr:hypothetical protein [Herbiconiux daphne]MCS5737029.1 hypothetical protein [Herbiconiux daphne]